MDLLHLRLAGVNQNRQSYLDFGSFLFPLLTSTPSLEKLGPYLVTFIFHLPSTFINSFAIFAKYIAGEIVKETELNLNPALHPFKA